MEAARPAARRIAFVFTSMPVGGAEDFALGAGPHLAPDFEAHYVCLRELGRLGEEARTEGRPVHLVPVFSSRWITPWAIRRFAAWLRRENIAAVHSQTHHAHVFATKAAELAGIPSVVHQQKTLEELPPRRRRIFRACVDRASHVVALSEQTARDLEEALAVPAGKISVVANGIERSVFCPPADRSALRRQLGLPDGVLLAASVGRLHHHKSHETTIEAVALARRQGVAVTAVLVGEGARRADLEDTLPRLDLPRDWGIADRTLVEGYDRVVSIRAHLHDRGDGHEVDLEHHALAPARLEGVQKGRVAGLHHLDGVCPGRHRYGLRHRHRADLDIIDEDRGTVRRRLHEHARAASARTFAGLPRRRIRLDRDDGAPEAEQRDAEHDD